MSTISKPKSDVVYRGVTRIMDVVSRAFTRLTIVNPERLPRVGDRGIVVLNHISYFDPVLVGAGIGRQVRVHALAKESLFRIPVVGYLLTKMDHIPVYRNSKRAGDALDAAITAARQGKFIALYPEGTIPVAEQVGKFKTGAARISMAAGVPVIPVGQWGAQEVLPHHVSSKDKVRSLLKSILKKRQSVFVVGVSLAAEEGESHKEFTGRMEAAVAALTEQARTIVERHSK